MRGALPELTYGAWLDDREDYYKALAKVFTFNVARTVEVLLEFWSDVLRACKQSRPARFVCGKKGNRHAGGPFSTPEVLHRIQRLEELRDNLGRNIQKRRLRGRVSGCLRS